MKNMMIDNNTLIYESVALLLQMLHDFFFAFYHLTYKYVFQIYLNK